MIDQPWILHLYRTYWRSWSRWGLHTTLHILVELGTSVLGWAERFVTSSPVSNGSTLSMFSTLMLESSYPIFFISCPSAYSYCLNQSQFPIMSIQYFGIERFLFYLLCLIKSECLIPNILINFNFHFSYFKGSVLCSYLKFSESNESILHIK